MDFGWINGTSRQKKPVIDTPFFTGEFLVDTNYTQSKANPIDHTVIGSTSIARDNEVSLAFLGLGGDFHIKNTRMRIMTQFGYRAVEIPRNDFSTFHGQYDLQNTLRYISEWNGGYHWDVIHGINVDAGIFMSYIGLFSYTASSRTLRRADAGNAASSARAWRQRIARSDRVDLAGGRAGLLRRT